MTDTKIKELFSKHLCELTDKQGIFRKDLLKQYYSKNLVFRKDLELILKNLHWINFDSSNVLFLYEIKYCIDNNIFERPVCPNCNIPVPFSRSYKKYMEYCSKKCKYEYEKLTQEWAKEPDIRNKQKVLDFIKQETYKSQKNQYVDAKKSIKFCKIHEEFIQKIVDKYCCWIQPPFKDRLTEIIYCLENDITERPNCEICGNPVSFIQAEKRYAVTCSNKNCQAQYALKQVDFKKRYENIKESFQKKYGTDIPELNFKNIS